MGRRRAVLALVVLLAGAGGCTYTSDDDGSGGIDSSTPEPRAVAAERGGEALDVCTAAGASRVLADESFDLEGVRWVFCAAGRDEDVVALRSVGFAEWEARDVPISGDDSVVVTIADAGRAWVTHDGVESGEHEHAWTADEGRTWTRIIGGE